MALTNAERQRRYREKQKQLNKQAFLEKEAKRKRNSYVPSALLAPKELKKRREIQKAKSQRHYDKVRKAKPKNVVVDESDPGPSSASLVVKLPSLHAKGKNVRKTYRRSLRKAYRDNENLKQKNLNLERKNKKLQKRIERMRQKVDDTESLEDSNADADESNMESEISFVEMTPRTKTNAQLRSLGLDKRKQKNVRRTLLLSNTIVHNFKPILKQKKKKSSFPVWTKAFAKYRCISELGRTVGVSRRKLGALQKQRKASMMLDGLRDTVLEFLEREDNSTTLPGKSDTKKSNKETKQKHILSDYMLNLYEKFRLENPQIKLSRATFYRLRPAHIILANFANRRTCLCSKHQNLALKIKALNSLGIKCSKNPDVIIKSNDTNDSIIKDVESLAVATIQYRQWKRVQDGDKMRMKEVDISITKADFIGILDKDLTEFREHVKRISNQYNELRSLRENLFENELLIWMDFAENFGCATVEEVQSAYWNCAMVSLHTMVVYFPDKTIQSYVAVSDVLSHNAIAVYTILRKLIHQLKEANPHLTSIHYLSDSPTSQYRNKTMFQYVAMHYDEFGLYGRWSYLESGHGKGPCDGLGASVKRAADNAIKQGKFSIQCAQDFYKWSESAMTSGSKVKFFMYNQDDYNISQEILSSRPLPTAVKGTFKIHYVIGTRNLNEIYTRELTCYCKNCTVDVTTSECGYTLHNLIKKNKKNIKNTQITEHDDANVQEIAPIEGDTQIVDAPIEGDTQIVDAPIEGDTLNVDSWVIAVYDDNWYIAQVMGFDETDGEIHVNFMESSGKYGNSYKWPKKNGRPLDNEEGHSVRDEKRTTNVWKIRKTF